MLTLTKPAPIVDIAGFDTRVVNGETFRVVTVTRAGAVEPTYEVLYVREDGTTVVLTDANSPAYRLDPTDDELTCLLAEHRCGLCWQVFRQLLDGDPCSECF